MRRFSNLYESLNQTNSTNRKVELLEDYFKSADPSDQAWAIYFLAGNRLKRFVKSTDLRRWILGELDIPEWLFEDSYAVVGDLAETLTLLLQKSSLNIDDDNGANNLNLSLSNFISNELFSLKEQTDTFQLEKLREIWSSYSGTQLYLIHKFLTGGFRVGVSKRLVYRALAKAYDLEESFIARHFMGNWQPSDKIILELIDSNVSISNNPAKPYPFCLAYPLDKNPEDLGDLKDWQVEWKWDGIRAQVIKRSGQVFIWSRGEELINHQFPEIVKAAQLIPDGNVMDGEILVWDIDKPGPFHQLQTRLGRQKPSLKVQQQLPCVLLAYDLIETKGTDLRSQTLARRRSLLEDLIRDMSDESRQTIQLSSNVLFDSWSSLADGLSEAAKKRAEGYMLKHMDSPYQDGRKKGFWWKWKVEPLHLDVVLIYAQAGHGRRANLYTDYTLAVWDDDDLVPIAKAYSGLKQEEIEKLDRWIKRNTEERFGPVRRVKPEQVLEIAFEGISPSKRHKSGLALRFPRVARWREDKLAKDADTLERAHELLKAYLEQR